MEREKNLFIRYSKSTNKQQWYQLPYCLPPTCLQMRDFQNVHWIELSLFLGVWFWLNTEILRIHVHFRKAISAQISAFLSKAKNQSKDSLVPTPKANSFRNQKVSVSGAIKAGISFLFFIFSCSFFYFKF